MILKEIERLRALAVLIVLNSHVPGIGLAFMPTHYFGAGWPGVDLFFVISGFVISTSFLKTLPEVKSAEGWLARLKASRHALSDFYIKRAFRILPSALLWLAVPIAATALLGTVAHYGTLDDVLREAFDVITLRHNYTAALGAPGNIGVYWSLVIEEHFYILFPLLMILFWTRRSRLMVAVGGILMTWFVIRPFLPVPGGPAAWVIYQHHWVSHRKFDGLLLGVVLGLLRLSGAKIFSFKPKRIFTAPIVLICILGVWCTPALMSSEQLHAWGMSVITACAGVLVYLAALDQGHVFEIPVLKQVFEYIGSRSFGLYLIQGFTLRAVILTDFAIREQFSGVLAWAPAFTAFRVVYLAGLTFVLVECNYQFLEKPMIRRGRAIVARRSLRLQASHSAVASAITKS